MVNGSFQDIAENNLGRKVFVGGSFLLFRQGLSLLISLFGVVLLTRWIGPSNYGLYNAGMGIYLFIYYLIQFGINVYLIRKEGEIKEEEYNTAFSFLILVSILAITFSEALIPFFSKWTRLDGFNRVAMVIFLCYPFSLANLIPISKLERELNYKRVALIELFAQIVYYLIGLPLAFLGAGVWAPVAGWWIQQLSVVSLSSISAKYKPRFYLDKNLLKKMLGYGFSYSISFWIWQFRNLVNPLIVGRFLGANGVGHVALAIRIVEILTFARSVVWRISIAVMGKLQREKERILEVINEGMRIGLLAIFSFVLPFSIISKWIIPLFFGNQWIPVLKIFPFIAMAYIVNSVFSLHSSALYTIGKNKEVAIFHLVHIILFAGSAFILIPHTGLLGYGLGEFSAFLSYAVIHYFILKNFGNPKYSIPFFWLFSLSLPLFHETFGIFVYLTIPFIFVFPKSRKELARYWGILRELIFVRGSSTIKKDNSIF
jgi:PST family polysaccharide transporter